jgi:hypothetical protein
MAVPGFDGKVREKPPSVSRWLLLSVVIGAVWWLASFYLFGLQTMFLWALFFLMVPSVLSILVALRMGLAPSGPWTSYQLVGLAVASTFFAGFVLMAVAG